MDMYLATLTDPQATVDALDALDVAVPDPLRTNAAVFAALADSIGDPRQHASHFIERLDRGDVTPDEAVAALLDVATRQAAADVAGGLWHDARNTLQRRHRALVREHGDGIVEQVRTAFRDAAAHLAQVIAKVGAADPDAEEVLEAGDEARQAWDELAPAKARVDAAAQVRRVLAAEGYGDRADTADRYIERADTMARLERARAIFDEGGIPALIAAGVPVTLHTVSSQAEMVANAQQATRREEEAAAATVSEDELRRRQRISDAWTATALREGA